MNRANCSKGLLRGLAALTVLFTATSDAWAATQGPAPGANALDPSHRSAPEGLGTAMGRAETLFQEGGTALSQGREAAARLAFDEALDVFVVLQGAHGADPAFQRAYLGLIDRIHAAELGAGTARRSLPQAAPAPTPVAPPSVTTIPEAAVTPENGNTLAEMGAKIEAAQPTEADRQSNEAVLGTEEIDLPIELNNQVLGAIDLYSGRYRNWFSRALSRGLPHLPRIREILAEAGIPQDLAYVPIVESAFNPTALSRAKAKGLWQFIPSTGKQYGLKQDFFVDERSNMEKATLAAAQYLKKLYAMFGDWNLALAGYNAGEGKVQRAIRKVGTNDFWALAKTKSFRSETKNYVPLIHAAIVISKSPESYGIELAPEAATAAETIRVAGSYPITTVARCASLEPQMIRTLNPELRRGMTPSSPFDLRVPQGVGEQIATCLAGERALDYTRHVVRKSDTFSLIGRMFGVSAAEVARANGMTLSSRLRPGTELAIPRSRSNRVAASAPPSGGTRSYRIRKGDTLSHVAAKHSTTVAAIKALNGLNSTRLSIGQILVVSSVASETLND